MSVVIKPVSLTLVVLCVMVSYAMGQTHATLPYTDGFESGTLGASWTTQSDDASGRIQVSTANTPFAGTYHLTMDVNPAGTLTQNEAWLHLDLSAETQVVMTFYWKEFGDENHAEDGIFFSDNAGTNFTQVMTLNGESQTNNTWGQVTLDVDDLAISNGLSLNNQFVVKFQQRDQATITNDGFAFDDISVTAFNCSPTAINTFPYTEDFESGTFDAEWCVPSNTGGQTIVSDQNTPNGGTYHMTMDAYPSGTISLNEAELYLDLSAQTDLDFQFYWKEFGDENDATVDGIFLSDNGGTNFTQVVVLNGSNYTNDTWQFFSFDLDRLASDNGLSFTANFIIKFSHQDNAAIAADGFAFDDISISAPVVCTPTAINTFPYTQGFESGSFDAEWCVSTNNFARTVVTDQNTPNGGTYHMTMDANPSGNIGLNEAELYLDLSAQTDLDFQFYWKEFGDENDATVDGIFLSDNGGTNFTQVVVLNGTAYTNDTWQLFSFDLDQLASDNGLSFTANFIIKFSHQDNAAIAADGFAFDDISISAPVVCTPTAINTFPYTQGFESGSFDAEWCVPTNNFARTIVTDQNTPNGGTYHMTMDANPSGNIGLNEAELYLDLSAQTDLDFQFYWKEFGDENDATVDGIFLSDNGGTNFTQVVVLNGSAYTNDTWQLFSFDLDQLASDNGLSFTANFIIKFSHQDNAAIAADGFAFDDISISAPVVCTPTAINTFPYTQGFESGSFDAEWCVPTNNFARTVVSDQNTPNTGTYDMTMDANPSGNIGLNEAELYLDLSAQTEMELEFYWKEFGDENDATVDGIFLSDNGGTNFTQVVVLNGSDYTNDTWQQFVFDLDRLASDNGLSFTANFIIKFSHQDNAAIAADGFAFDDIVVREPIPCTPTAATVPFLEDFESGSFGSSWCIPNNNFARTQITSANTPHGGSFHMTMDASPTGNIGVNEADLYVSLQSLSQVELQFYWKDFGDENDATVDGVFFSDDGGSNFTQVINLIGTDHTNDTWRQFKLDLDELASSNGLTLNANFVIRFSHQDNAAITNDGFAFDDIRVFVPSCNQFAASFPYVEDFETGSVGAEWCFDNNNYAANDITTVNTPQSGNYHLIMDAAPEGNLVTNSAELFINLSGQTNATLEFYWKDFTDENHAEDGVFFSDDRGANYVNVLAFNPESVTDDTWQFVSLDVDNLATLNGLTLNDQFVIKFQHRDNLDFVEDGIAIDEIRVFNNTTTWTGTNGTNWNDAGNWNNGLPDCNSLANIPDVSGASNNFPAVDTGSDPTVGSITIENGASLTIANTYTLNVCSSWRNLGSSNIGTGTVAMVGTGVQTISGSTIFDDLVMNNIGAGASLLNDQTISSSLTLTDGIILTNTNTLTLNAGTTSGTGSNSSHVEGQLRKLGNTDFSFPMGDEGIWAPVDLANLTGDVNTEFTARYYFDTHTNFNLLLTPDPNGDLNNVSTLEYWTLENTGTSSNADVTLHWKDQNRSEIDDYTDLVIAHYTGSVWENLGQSSRVGANPGSITVNGVSSFSPFTFGSTSSSSNPLPVELIYFNGIVEGFRVDLSWSTATEQNNDYFLIERSHDALRFEEIGRVSGGGNSLQRLDYSFSDDRPGPGVNYYRLKQVDFDGKFEYSPVIAIDFELPLEIHIYPNPASDNVIIISENLGAEVSLDLLNLSGNSLFSQITIAENTDVLSFNLDLSSVPSGIYLIKLTGVQREIVKRLIVNK